MGSITAVEIGADTCALASTSVHKEELRVHAAETLDPAAFPGMDAFTLALQQTRRSLKLPRSCRAVVWGLPDGATRKDPTVAPLIEPLTRAGFRVKRVVTPCNALGALARLRTSRTGGAMCWLGINRNGVAIVVIRPGKLLYSHSFAWDSNVGATGSQARLLQRYSLVAFLAPEVRRAIAAAKEKGTTVDGIVTCGNLPDLRALTMPLIEELDIEVETLDSLEGLVMKPELADKLAEVAPTIRLACAGAFARETRVVDESKRLSVRRASRVAPALAAAAVALIAGGYWWYTASRPATGPLLGAKPVAKPPASNTGAAKAPARTVSSPTAQSSSSAPPSKPPEVTTAPTASAVAPAAARSQPVAPPPTATPKNPPASPAPLASASASGPPASAGSVKPGSAGSPPTVPPAKPGPSGPPASAGPAKPGPAGPPAGAAPAKPGATALQSGETTKNVVPQPVSKGTARQNAVSAPAPVQPAGRNPSPRAPTKPAPDTPVALNSTPRSADKPDAASPGRSTEKPLPELLKDPVPKVTAILVSADRRLATIGDEGQIVGVGDTIGRRVVVAIDDRTVLLREPSGVQIRVALGGRVIAVQRPVR